MAAAKGRKTQKRRKTQNGRTSQKRRTSQHGRRQKSHGGRSPAKQTKRRVPPKRQPMKKPKRSPSTPNRPTPGERLLSDQAQSVMADLVRHICNEVSSEAERLRRRSRHRLVGPTHVQAALRRLVPKRTRGPVPTASSKNRD